MFKHSINNFKNIGKDLTCITAGSVSLVKDVLWIPLEFIRDMKEIVEECAVEFAKGVEEGNGQANEENQTQLNAKKATE